MPRMEVSVEHVSELIKLSSEMINKTDQINQRLVNSIVVMCMVFCLTAVCVSYLYFTTDYGYGSVTQNQTNTENSNQTNNKGVK
jgi:hypothetical protein